MYFFPSVVVGIQMVHASRVAPKRDFAISLGHLSVTTFNRVVNFFCGVFFTIQSSTLLLANLGDEIF